MKICLFRNFKYLSLHPVKSNEKVTTQRFDAPPTGRIRNVTRLDEKTVVGTSDVCHCIFFSWAGFLIECAAKKATSSVVEKRRSRRHRQ